MSDFDNIFKKADEEEQKKSIFNPTSAKQNDEEWIRNNLSKLLDDEMDFKMSKGIFDSDLNGGNYLAHQFESADNNNDFVENAFAKADQSYKNQGYGLVFPDDKPESKNSFERKFDCKSNPTNELNNFESQGVYFPPDNNFKSYEREFNFNSNYGYEAQYSQPMGFETFGQMNYHNTPYSQQPAYDVSYFPEVEQDHGFNSNAGIFAAFDKKDNGGSYSSHGSSGQE